MDQVKAKWRNAAWIALPSFLIALLFLAFPGNFLERLSFDLITVIRSGQSTADIVILELDEKSHEEKKQVYGRPWSRMLHAELLERLKSDGARLAVFDVTFFDPGTTAEEKKEDLLFGQAIQSFGRVVAGMEYVSVPGSGILATQPRYPIEPVKEAVAALGSVDLPRDNDGAVRRHFKELERFRSLPLAAAEMSGRKLPARLKDRFAPRWLRYYGAQALDDSRRSYSDALLQPAGFFKDKVVFVGGAPATKFAGQAVDTFRTPYSRFDGKEIPGVEILAINYLNLVRGDWLAPASLFSQIVSVFLMALIAGFIFVVLQGAARFAMVLALCGLVLLLAFWLPAAHDLWFSWLAVILEVLCAWFLASRFDLKISATSEAPVAGPISVAGPLVVPELAAKATATNDTTVAVPDHELVKMVGRGAYGEVWLARNAIGTFHAVKITFRSKFKTDDPFDREFRGIQWFMPISTKHPGFVNILHVGGNVKEGYFYCVMEAADDEKTGRKIDPAVYSPRTLASELKARNKNRLPLKECIQISIHLTEALGFLHQKGLIHRDIKPANIIFVDGLPKLADIGLVTEAAEDENKVSYLGTRGYIAPEGPGSPGADIFSLGKVIYEASMGLDCEQFPELPKTFVETIDEKSVHLIRLNQILLKACEPNPNDRYKTSAELQNDLLALSKAMG